MRSIHLLLLLIVSSSLMAQSDLKNWPQGASPEEIGLKVAERFVKSPHAIYNSPNTKPHIPYFEVCAWYGSLTFAKLTSNADLRTRLIDRFTPLFDKDSALLPIPDHVDYTVFGALPLEIYLQTKEKRYLYLGKNYADKQWAAPEGPRVIPESYNYFNKDYSWQTRMWIDDMYMITLIQAQAYRATGDKKYIERAANEMILYLDELQKPNGLFYHAPEAPFFWGRGNGWMAAGMTELLSVLPKKNRHYETIMKGYKIMMESLLKYQGEDGMWRQLIDEASYWPETSCTAMFIFAMISGVKNGWLDKKIYGKAARKGWMALVTYINANGEITDVCEGTGMKNDKQYYMDRKRLTGDLHGEGTLCFGVQAHCYEQDNRTLMI